MESLPHDSNIYQCNTGYSIRFNLPDGTPVRLSNPDKATLLRVANELYRHKAAKSSLSSETKNADQHPVWHTDRSA